MRNDFDSKIILTIFLSNLLFIVPVQGQEVVIGETAASRNVIQDASITVYSQNGALVRQAQSFSLEQGINNLSWLGVATGVDLNSIDLRAIDSDQKIKIKEENFKSDTASTGAILAKYIGKNVDIRNFYSNGQSVVQSGKLLNISPFMSLPNHTQDLVIKTNDRLIINPVGQIEVADLPAGLASQPQLNFKVEASKKGQDVLKLTYRANNISWACNYIGVLNAKQNKMDLTAMVVLNNNCGASFKNARLKLMSGELHTDLPTAIQYGVVLRANEASVSGSRQFQEKAFADYHLYNYDGLLDIDNRDTKRIALLDGENIPVTKEYVFEEAANNYLPNNKKSVVQAKLEFRNDAQDQLGKPLPAGQVKIYQEDEQHELQLVGEDRIEHTPIGEKISLVLGNAFDVTAEKIKTSSEQISDHHIREKYAITFRNHLNHDIVITDIEHTAYEDYKVIANPPYKKIDANTFQCDVPVSAAGSATVNYQLDGKM